MPCLILTNRCGRSLIIRRTVPHRHLPRRPRSDYWHWVAIIGSGVVFLWRDNIPVRHAAASGLGNRCRNHRHPGGRTCMPGAYAGRDGKIASAHGSASAIRSLRHRAGVVGRFGGDSRHIVGANSFMVAQDSLAQLLSVSDVPAGNRTRRPLCRLDHGFDPSSSQAGSRRSDSGLQRDAQLLLAGTGGGVVARLTVLFVGLAIAIILGTVALPLADCDCRLQRGLEPDDRRPPASRGC